MNEEKNVKQTGLKDVHDLMEDGGLMRMKFAREGKS